LNDEDVKAALNQWPDRISGKKERIDDRTGKRQAESIEAINHVSGKEDHQRAQREARLPPTRSDLTGTGLKNTARHRNLVYHGITVRTETGHLTFRGEVLRGPDTSLRFKRPDLKSDNLNKRGHHENRFGYKSESMIPCNCHFTKVEWL
jgi:hypothetical protein